MTRRSGLHPEPRRCDQVLGPLADRSIVIDDAALSELAPIDAQQARIVELRAFGGLEVEETAEVLGISPATVKRHWTFALAWLQQRLGSQGGAGA